MTSSTFFKAAFLFCAFCLSHILSAQDIKPIKGKWNAGDARDYVGFWKLSQKKGYLDGSGNGTITGITTVLGNAGDVPVTLNYQGDSREEIATYRPSTREMNYFADYSQSGSISYIRAVGNPNDQVITGDWNGDGVDGYALYRPSTRELWYYQNIDSPQPLTSFSVGNPGDIPIAGNWDGLNGDGYALYRPSTRQIIFYQNYNDTQPFTTWGVGNSGDVVIAGDWDGNGTDGIALFRQSSSTDYQFWLYPTIGASPTQSIFFSDTGYASDVTGGRQFFYAQKVPHVDVSGNYRETYDPNLSFVPKGLYHVPQSAYSEVYGAGFNLAFLYPLHYPLDTEGKAKLDATGNKLKIIPYLETTLELNTPFIGKFTGTADLPGVAAPDNSTPLIYYDSNGDNVPDVQFKVGNGHDLPITGDWNGDGKDEYALFRLDKGQILTPQIVYYPDMSTNSLTTISTGDVNDKKIMTGNWDGVGGDGYALYDPNTRRLSYYQNYDDTQWFYRVTLSAADAEDIIFPGDWNGDGRDGYAIYKPALRKFFFYQDYNSTAYIYSQVFGNPGDIPVAGDWDGDGVDGFGVFRSDDVRSRNEIWYYNTLGNTLHSMIFGNPLIENLPKKYCFGIYMGEEYSGRAEAERQTKFTYLSHAYAAYNKPDNSEVMFHVDDHYMDPTDPAANTWWKTFTKMGEAMGHDVYPVQRSATEPSAAAVKSIAAIAKTVEQARIEGNDMLPNWFVAQAFRQTLTNYDFFMPTPEQYKGMVYTGLVHGATGILTFMYADPAFADVGGISSTVNVPVWNKAQAVNQEIDQLKPYLLNVTSPALYNIATNVVPSYESLPIRSVLKLVNGYYVLITVNVTAQPLNAIIQLTTGVAPSDRVVERMFEGTTTQTLAGAINDSYGAFGVHVYKFKAPSGGFGGGRLRPQEEAPAVAKTEKETELLKVYPVPSKGSVNFDIGDVPDAEVTLVLYDGKGQVVKTFHESDPAHKRLLWEGTTDRGDAAQPGIYFYKLSGTSRVIGSGKFILIH
jgi:hypothetical protein